MADNLLSRLSIKRHAPPNWKRQISPDKLTTLIREDKTICLLVLAADIRKSTQLMKEAISHKLFAGITAEFVKEVRATARKRHAWFNKFTGDGFIVYWLRETEYSDRDITDMLSFCREVREVHFPAAKEKYMKNSRNFPTDVGICIGIDAGPCALVEIEALDVVGSPVVGAIRLTSNEVAKSGEIYCNVQLGQRLLKGRFCSKNDIKVLPRSIQTKEYPQGQDIYQIMLEQQISS